MVLHFKLKFTIRGARGVCGVKSPNPTPQKNYKTNKELYKLAIIEIKRIIKNL